MNCSFLIAELILGLLICSINSQLYEPFLKVLAYIKKILRDAALTRRLWWKADYFIKWSDSSLIIV